MPLLPPLTALRAFEAAARLGSFTRAGDELGVTSAAIGLQVRQLEEHFGKKLFLRTGNRLTLTDAGRAIQPRLDLAFSEIAALAEDLGAGVQDRRLVVSCLASLADHWLMPRLVGFARVGELEVRIEDDPVQLVPSSLRLTYGGYLYPDHQVHVLFQDQIIPVAAPGQGLDALIHTDWGPSHAAAPSWQRWFAASRRGTAPEAGLRVGQTALALAAARAGLGAALVPERLATADLRAGLITRLDGPALPMPWPYVLIAPPTQGRRKLAAVLLAHLQSG